jgi:hypothetical protein
VCPAMEARVLRLEVLESSSSRIAGTSMGFKITQPSVFLVDIMKSLSRTLLSHLALSLKKKHNAIAYYHKVTREAVAAGIVKIAHVRYHENRADILTLNSTESTIPLYPLTKVFVFQRNNYVNHGGL